VLEFLRDACESPLLYPEFLGGNVEQGLLVLEDLGDTCLSKLLFRDDPDPAESYLTDLVRILGRLHAQTCKRGAEYRSIREQLGPTERHFLSVVEPPDAHSNISKRLCAWLAAICDAFDVEPCKEWASDIELIAASVDKPGPYECLTHGDFCPGNDLLVGGQLRFIDFEISSFRHALIDGPADPSIFHRAGRGEAIPFEVQLKLRDAYREELAKGCPEAGDDTSFYEEVTRICVYRCLFQLKSVLREDILTRNDRWGSTTDWQRIFKALDSVVWTTESYSGIEGIGKTAERIREKLRKTWPHTAQVSPPFPAFA
jgi:tRNA A-37 threonylcarbamoyl transferase component Bud32